MRSIFKTIATILVVLSGLTTAISIVALFSDPHSLGVFNATILGGSVISLLLSGALWLLADIAESVSRIPRQP